MQHNLILHDATGDVVVDVAGRVEEHARMVARTHARVHARDAAVVAVHVRIVAPPLVATDVVVGMFTN